jgi:tRNA dimethylallyltransferase
MAGNVGFWMLHLEPSGCEFPNVVRTIEIEAFRFASLKQRIGIRHLAKCCYEMRLSYLLTFRAMMVPVLAGPTASGKTALALELAKSLPLEVISADAMMVYKGMDIGTAKPTSQEQTLVRHHLIDVIYPNQAFSVADYVKLAEAAIEDVRSRKKIPLLVGGTGFYIRALSEGLPTVPEADEQVQADLWKRLEKEGLDALLKELEGFSPTDAERSERNPRRVVRALEIIKRTGQAPSTFPKTRPRFAYDKMILLPSLETLRPRIEARTEHMFSSGLIDEVIGLFRIYPDLPTAKQAIGYKEAVDYLAGLKSLEQTKAEITLATTQYAKRQRTWFRKEPEARVVEAVDVGELVEWLKG